MHRGAWRATVRRVAESQAWDLSWIKREGLALRWGEGAAAEIVQGSMETDSRLQNPVTDKSWRREAVWWRGVKCGSRDFPGGPGVKTLCFPCRGSGFHSCSGN